MTLSSERLADVDAQLEALGVTDDRISEVRARIAENFSPDLNRIDDSLAELASDLQGLDEIVAPSSAREMAPMTVELDLEELDIEELDIEEMEFTEGDEAEAGEVSASEPESPFDEPLPESPFDEPVSDASASGEEPVAVEAATLSAQDLFNQAMEDDSVVPGAIDDLAGMLEEEVSASGEVDAPSEDEPNEGSDGIESLLGEEEGEPHAEAEPSALVDLASLEADEGDAMVEIGAALEEEASEDSAQAEGEPDDEGDDDPEGGEKKGFFKKLFG